MGEPRLVALVRLAVVYRKSEQLRLNGLAMIRTGRLRFGVDIVRSGGNRIRSCGIKRENVVVHLDPSLAGPRQDRDGDGEPKLRWVRQIEDSPPLHGIGLRCEVMTQF